MLATNVLVHGISEEEYAKLLTAFAEERKDETRWVKVGNVTFFNPNGRL